MDKEPGRTRDVASRENQDVEERQSFPTGSIDSTVGENSQNRESRTLAPVQEIWSRGFYLFDEQPQRAVSGRGSFSTVSYNNH